MIFFQVFVLFFMVVITLGLREIEEGEPCFRERTGEPGTCKRLSECPVALAAVKYNINPQLCGLSGIHTIVCCLHSTDENTSPSTSSSSSPSSSRSTTSTSSSSSSPKKNNKKNNNCPSSVPSTGIIGSACKTDSGKPGKCLPMKDCQSAIDAIMAAAKSGKKPQTKTCFMVGTVQAVCCGA